MQTILNPNIELIKQRLRNGIDNNPLNAESLGRNWIGPARKNLLIPKEEANKLRIKVMRGNADFVSSPFVNPLSPFGKNPSVVNNIARDILTYHSMNFYLINVTIYHQI